MNDPGKQRPRNRDAGRLARSTNLIQILSNYVCDVAQLVMIEFARGAIDESGSAMEVKLHTATSSGAVSIISVHRFEKRMFQILLIRFSICRVFIENVGRASFDL